MYKILLRLLLCTAILPSMAVLPAGGQEYPYEWLSLGMSEDPSTIQRIRWRTTPDMPEAVAELAPASASPLFYREAVRYEAVSTVENDYGLEKAYHHVTFDGLEPGGSYLYRVGDGERRWSGWYEFTAARGQNEPFKFIYISDVQVGIHDRYPRVARKAAVTAGDASFVMFTGDMVGGASEWEWNAFFRSNEPLFSVMPVAAIPDSHEYARRPGDDKRTLTTYWDHLFSYPENTPQELVAQGNYWFDYQSCRFVMINTKELMDGTDEFRGRVLEWMEEVIASNPHPWCVVGQHQPVYSVAEGRTSDRIKEYLKPLYDKYDIALVLSGHDHVYARTRGEDRSGDGPLSGPVYVVSVAGPQVYVPEYQTYMDRIGSNIQLFHTVEVDQKNMAFKSYLATGELYDHFVISKDGHGKYYSDKAVGWPEITDIPTETWQEYTDEDMENFREKRSAYIESKK